MTGGLSWRPLKGVPDGAAWRIDDGEWLPAATTVDGIPPGRHRVAFSRLAGWCEPAPLDILVVSGAVTELESEYAALRRHFVLSLPRQITAAGEVAFIVESREDASDFFPPREAVLIAASADPPPQGELSFDTISGEFRYVPSPDDRLSFNVRFTAQEGGTTIARDVTITPRPSTPPEDTLIAAMRPSHGGEVDVAISVSSEPKQRWNHKDMEPLRVVAAGNTVIIEAGNPNLLFDRFNASDKVKSFEVYAETLIIRDPIYLPQAQVSIRAREVRFEDDGWIDTTPVSLKQLPGEPGEGDSGADGLFSGKSPGRLPRVVRAGCLGVGGGGKSAPRGPRGREHKNPSCVATGPGLEFQGSA